MSNFQLQTHAEQVAGYLKEELRRRRWKGTMPGVLRLEKELGVNRNTLEAGLKILEEEGLLVSQGVGKRRRIEMPEHDETRRLRVGILTMDMLDRSKSHIIEILHRLQEAGHVSFYALKTVEQLGEDLKRVVKMVQAAEADAWVVVGGFREILEWFEGSGIPAFALFGRRSEFKIAAAGPDKSLALEEVVSTLIGLGHRRIVLLNHHMRRHPEPGKIERHFINKLNSLGIATGSYNMPDWDVSAEGFRRCLDELFRYSPPTALIADEVTYYLAAMQYCGNLGMKVPDDISLVCMDGDPVFEFFQPSVSHVSWDPEPPVRRVVSWVHDVAEGRNEKKQLLTKAEFVLGGTVGKVIGD